MHTTVVLKPYFAPRVHASKKKRAAIIYPSSITFLTISILFSTTHRHPIIPSVPLNIFDQDVEYLPKMCWTFIDTPSNASFFPPLDSQLVSSRNVIDNLRHVAAPRLFSPFYIDIRAPCNGARNEIRLTTTGRPASIRYRNGVYTLQNGQQRVDVVWPSISVFIYLVSTLCPVISTFLVPFRLIFSG